MRLVVATGQSCVVVRRVEGCTCKKVPDAASRQARADPAPLTRCRATSRTAPPHALARPRPGVRHRPSPWRGGGGSTPSSRPSRPAVRRGARTGSSPPPSRRAPWADGTARTSPARSGASSDWPAAACAGSVVLCHASISFAAGFPHDLADNPPSGKLCGARRSRRCARWDPIARLVRAPVSDDPGRISPLVTPLVCLHAHRKV